VLTLNLIAMKKNLLFSTFLCFAINIFSQSVEDNRISWGIRGGFDLSYRTKFGYHESEGTAFSEFLSVYAQKRVNETTPFYLQSELLYKTFLVDNYNSLKTMNLELPISIKFSPRGKGLFYIYTGFAPVFPLRSADNYGNKATHFDPRINLSYFAGTSVQLPFWHNRLGLDFRYCGYLADNYIFITFSSGGARVQVQNNASTFDFALIYKIK
jgi:hypothetical protein